MDQGETREDRLGCHHTVASLPPRDSHTLPCPREAWVKHPGLPSHCLPLKIKKVPFGVSNPDERVRQESKKERWHPWPLCEMSTINLQESSVGTEKDVFWRRVGAGAEAGHKLLSGNQNCWHFIIKVPQSSEQEAGLRRVRWWVDWRSPAQNPVKWPLPSWARWNICIVPALSNLGSWSGRNAWVWEFETNLGNTARPRLKTTQ